MAQLDCTGVAKLARLARLDLNAAELNMLAPQLDAIVAYESRLSELDLARVEPLAHPLDAVNHLRDDHLLPSLPLPEALANAPQQRDGLFAVPPTLE
ncbi:MAG: Asp-tRNA(Asn)/Glu-tRNA(Gln) amidotransferase subunit GatC [Gemmataceae bacterium]